MERVKTEAFVLIKKGASKFAFQRQTIELCEPEGDQLLIETEAFGLNYADVMARNGLYREAPPMPCVIGYEVVGTVISCGKNVSPELVGKRVVGFTRFGGYSQKVITNQYAITEIGDLDAGIALSLCTQGVTAYYMATYFSPVRKGDNVLIHAAAGGVGSLLIQLAKHSGATVFAKVRSEEKELHCRKLGADYTLNYQSSDYEIRISELLNDKKMDVIFNPVGGTTFKKDLRLLGPGGKLILYGGSELSGTKWGVFSSLNFVRKMGFIIPVGLMMSSKSIIGVNMLKIADEKPDVLQFCLNACIMLYNEGVLTPSIGGKYEASELAVAHDLLESGKSVGKIYVTWLK